MAYHKPGYITASTISPLLTGSGDSLLKGGLTYCKQIAAERSGMVRLDPVFTGNDATEWGLLYEHDATNRYEQARFVSVHSQQKTIEIGMVSCTTDGLIESDGMVQIKCPYNSLVHMDYLLDPAMFSTKYYDQVQTEMMVARRQWCDLVSYDPRWNEPLDIVIVRVFPDQQWRDKARIRIEAAGAAIARFANEIKQKSKSLQVSRP